MTPPTTTATDRWLGALTDTAPLQLTIVNR
jgi:hypothetical protein